MAWVIVEFSDRTVPCVPKKWLTKKGKVRKCYFPTSGVASKIKNAVDVDKNSGEWKLYSCRLLMDGQSFKLKFGLVAPLKSEKDIYTLIYKIFRNMKDMSRKAKKAEKLKKSHADTKKTSKKKTKLKYAENGVGELERNERNIDEQNDNRQQEADKKARKAAKKAAKDADNVTEEVGEVQQDIDKKARKAAKKAAKFEEMKRLESTEKNVIDEDNDAEVNKKIKKAAKKAAKLEQAKQAKFRGEQNDEITIVKKLNGDPEPSKKAVKLQMTDQHGAFRLNKANKKRGSGHDAKAECDIKIKKAKNVKHG